jgi:hypothetical protein
MLTKILLFMFLLTVCLSTAGCGDDVKLSLGGTHTSVKCIEGYKFAVVQMDKSVAMTQIMPPQRCE